MHESRQVPEAAPSAKALHLKKAANNSPIIHVVAIKILARLGKMYCWYVMP
jgi:hypothetical protein